MIDGRRRRSATAQHEAQESTPSFGRRVGLLLVRLGVSADAVRKKGITSLVAGHEGIPVVPDLEAGNMLAKPSCVARMRSCCKGVADSCRTLPRQTQLKYASCDPRSRTR